MGVYSIAAGGGLKKPRTIYPNMGINSPYIYGAMVPIAQATSSGSTSQLLFSNIPQTYQDLILVGSTRTAAAVTVASVYILINNNQATNRSVTVLSGNGSAASSSRFSGSTFMFSATLPGASSTANIFNAFNAHILNYTNTTIFKTVLTRNASDLNGSGVTELTANLLQSTSAVTSINVINDGFNNFAAGSTVTLYGIRTANS
jgi:hypothetical protein